MNANAEIHADEVNTTAENLTEILTNSTEYKTHEKNKSFKHIQTPRKAQNMTQYLSKYEDRINEISQYTVKIDEMDYYNDDIYKYDKTFLTEDKMNKRIINLIIDMYYNDESKRRITRMKIKFFIEKKMKHPFFLIEDNSETGDFHPLNLVFQYIKRTVKGKNGDKIFDKLKANKSEYVAEIKGEPLQHKFNCAVCFDDIVYTHIINYNCVCKDIICKACFVKLDNPKKCPLCRHTPYKLNLTLPKDEPAKRKFTIKYNNKNYKEDIQIDYLDDGVLCYFNTDTEKINYFRFRLETDEEVIKDFVGYNHNIFSFTVRAGIDYTHFHSKTSLNKKPLEILQDYYRCDGNDDTTEFIENVLGLTDEDEKVEFIREYYETYGIEEVDDEINEQIKFRIEKNRNQGNYYNVIFDDYNEDGGDFENLFSP